jgi:hypothetical protein
VRDEHAADAEPPVQGDPPVDVGAGTQRLALQLAAAEWAGGLDADEDRELAAADHTPGLARAFDQAQKPAPRAAAALVDVGLELP